MPAKSHQSNQSHRAFIDSNILLYTVSEDETSKQHQALDLLATLNRNRQVVISTQVLNEFANVALRKLGIPEFKVRQLLMSLCQFEVVTVTPAIILDALDLQQTRRLSYFDALMVITAHVSGCAILYTEDMNGGELVNGVKLVNPFNQEPQTTFQ